MVAIAIPATDAPYEKKFRKKVDSRILITIKNGRTTPITIRSAPNQIILFGVSHLILVTSTLQCDQVPVQNLAGLPRHTIPA
jgi:hypothetical protein